MHYMHYKDYIHHGLAAEKTPLPCHRGGPIWLRGGGVWGSLLIYIYIIIIFKSFDLYTYTLLCTHYYGVSFTELQATFPRFNSR